MEIKTQEYGSARRGGWCKLFAVLVLMAIMVIARPESAKADVNFSGATGVTFNESGYACPTGSDSSSLDNWSSYCFELQEPSMIALIGSYGLELYNESKERIWFANDGSVFIACGSGQVCLGAGKKHTIYRDYNKNFPYTQILAPMTFSVKKDHGYHKLYLFC
jgi:hypothetical protein